MYRKKYRQLIEVKPTGVISATRKLLKISLALPEKYLYVLKKPRYSSGNATDSSSQMDRSNLAGVEKWNAQETEAVTGLEEEHKKCTSFQRGSVVRI